MSMSQHEVPRPRTHIPDRGIGNLQQMAGQGRKVGGLVCVGLQGLDEGGQRDGSAHCERARRDLKVVSML